ncbi:MAG: Stk1 family PASTA domain-containing Ser/Thr kinase [Ruminococcus sp.]|nr:Stk1 family PASTA domain-containing Ser/Thr kinase [Ruminococcus sp.]
MDKYIGKRLDGRYEIHELIGVGGMANVYRCTDTLDDREVAIKILKDEYLNNEEFIRRFKNESKAIAMLSHQNIVKVYDVSFGDMIQYIVMEYIDGITLKEYIDQQGIIEWKDALHLTTQVLKALQHAHECGIVHRDIKPQNIMLLQDGSIKVTDFGIARFSDKATRTMTEQAIGSVHYIAPEQAKGDVTDGKTDIYSVGVMLYEMLTGRLPFDGESAVSVALMQLQSTPKRPREINPGIPIGLEQITMRAMQKQPEDRYASAAEMLSDIERFRLNPSIVFDYGQSFVDNQPTKFVGSIKDAKNEKSTVEKKDLTDSKYNDDFEDDDYVKEHKPVYYAIKGVLIAGLIVCLIFFILALVRGCTSTQSKDVEIPDFVGKTLVEVKEDNPNNFRFEINSRYDESKDMGIILAQEPAANSMKVKTGSSITLTVNGTDTEMTVPFVQNFTEKEASKALKDKSLMPEVVYVENTKTPKGYVIDSFPKAGAKSTIGSTVYLYVANGERTEQVTVPSYLGKSIYEAQDAFGDVDLTFEIVYDDESKEDKDVVISSSPLPYCKVDPGTVVTLTVSSGKGNRRKVNIFVDLPPDVEESVNMEVFINGVLDSSNSKTLVPMYNKTYTLEVMGSGTSSVIVQLDGRIYREYTVDFASASVTSTINHDYYVPTTAPPEEVTDPVVETPTAAPVTEEIVPTAAPETQGGQEEIVLPEDENIQVLQ